MKTTYEFEWLLWIQAMNEIKKKLFSCNFLNFLAALLSQRQITSASLFKFVPFVFSFFIKVGRNFYEIYVTISVKACWLCCCVFCNYVIFWEIFTFFSLNLQFDLFFFILLKMLKIIGFSKILPADFIFWSVKCPIMTPWS